MTSSKLILRAVMTLSHSPPIHIITTLNTASRAAEGVTLLSRQALNLTVTNGI